MNKVQCNYYELALEDCCCPSFSSGTKYYHARMSDISMLMDALKADNANGIHDDTLAAFAAYQNGDLEVTHQVDYSQRRLLTSEELVAYEDFPFDETTWEHTNVWDCVYVLKASAIDVSQIVVRQGQRYIRCIRPIFRDLVCRSSRFPKQEWRPVGKRFWGYPHMMVCDGKYTYPRLFMVQEYYEDLDQALFDMKDEKKLDYSVVFEEIFGDG